MKMVTVPSQQESLIELNVTDIFAPRWLLRPIDEKVVLDLTRSIENEGLLQPIVVRKCNGGYEIVFGRHRLEACKKLGMKTVPAMIGSMSEEEAFLACVSENLVRNTFVDPLQEAKGYRMLVENGWTINAIAKKIGKCDSYVSERLSILNRLDNTILSKIAERRSLTPSHAELISRLRDHKKQREVAEFVEKKHLSVRGLEAVLRGALPPPTKVRIQGSDSASDVIIPREYLKPLHLSEGCMGHMYFRGNKLILENLNGPKSRNNAQGA